MTEQEPLSLDFTVATGPDGEAQLQWRTTGAVSCVLDPGNETLPASGEKSVSTAEATLFTLTAWSDTGKVVQSQMTAVAATGAAVPPEAGTAVPPPTLLTYALSTRPSPLQINTEGILELAVNNTTRDDIFVKEIVVTLPVGTNAKDLTANAGGIQSARPGDWNVNDDKQGQLTLTPTGGEARIGGNGLIFRFSHFTTNAEVGTCNIGIDETSSENRTPREFVDRSTTLRISKFPAQFEIKTFKVDPTIVQWGGSATVTWNGTSGPGVNYKLSYQPRNEGPPVSLPVQNVGDHVASDLTRTNSVTFTLTVTMPDPSGDTPLTVQKQLSVTVLTLSVELVVLPTRVGANGLAWMQWEAANAVSCKLDPGNVELPPSGSRYVVVPETTPFTITARNAAGKTKQEQKIVTVSSSIVPTISGHTIAGQNGGEGERGRDAAHPGAGGDGGEGGDAILTNRIPPLDTSSVPTRVMPITLTGGNGGRGGRGGNGNDHRVQGPGGDGGPGGRGGDVTMAATFDAGSGSPAQFIVTLKPGTGGEGGEGGYPESVGGRGRKGRNGRNGVVKVTPS